MKIKIQLLLQNKLSNKIVLIETRAQLETI